MRRLFVLAALLFAVPAHAVTIEWVTVGDPGNAPDDTGHGSVAYVYRIGKYEVTNAEYTEFLNAVADTDTYGLYNTYMGWFYYGTIYGGIQRSGNPGSYTYSTVAGRENKPVGYVSLWDALRFANWLHNGKPAGPQDDTTTEDGAYTLDGYTGSDGSWLSRNASATIFLPSDDEWYKAAYYDPVSMSYNPYPFADGFNGAVCEVPAGATSHSANCDFPAVGNLTDVGAYTGSASEYATFDQGGNVMEWLETIVQGSFPRLRGGSFHGVPDELAASSGSYWYPDHEGSYFGFRVAMIPEPSTALLLATGLVGLAAARRQQRS